MAVTDVCCPPKRCWRRKPVPAISRPSLDVTISARGMDLIADICAIYGNYDFDTEACGVDRGPQLSKRPKWGPMGDLPPAVLRQLYQHPLTDKGLDAFLKDWAKTGQSILDAPSVAV